MLTLPENKFLPKFWREKSDYSMFWQGMKCVNIKINKVTYTFAKCVNLEPIKTVVHCSEQILRGSGRVCQILRCVGI